MNFTLFNSTLLFDMEDLFLIFSVINNDMMNSFVQSFLHPHVQFVLFPLDIMLHLHVLLFSSTNSESPSLTTVSERPEHPYLCYSLSLHAVYFL